LAKYTRQREYRPDCRERAGLCRFLQIAHDPQRRRGRRRSVSCC
jgi:hypothetical protein